MNAVDTNVLVYAYDTRDAARQQIATDLIYNLEDGVLLWQVACEFLAASRKLAPTGFTLSDAWGHLLDLQHMLPLAPPTPAVLERARRLTTDRDIHFWDAMIYAACLEAGVELIFSEDLPGGAVAGLQIINPFA